MQVGFKKQESASNHIKQRIMTKKHFFKNNLSIQLWMKATLKALSRLGSFQTPHQTLEVGRDVGGAMFNWKPGKTYIERTRKCNYVVVGERSYLLYGFNKNAVYNGETDFSESPLLNNSKNNAWVMQKKTPRYLKNWLESSIVKENFCSTYTDNWNTKLAWLAWLS